MVNTFETTNKLSSHRNMIIPCFRMDSDETCNNDWLKRVFNDATLVDICHKYLKEKKTGGQW